MWALTVVGTFSVDALTTTAMWCSVALIDVHTRCLVVVQFESTGAKTLGTARCVFALMTATICISYTLINVKTGVIVSVQFVSAVTCADIAAFRISTRLRTAAVILGTLVQICKNEILGLGRDADFHVGLQCHCQLYSGTFIPRLQVSALSSRVVSKSLLFDGTVNDVSELTTTYSILLHHVSFWTQTLKVKAIWVRLTLMLTAAFWVKASKNNVSRVQQFQSRISRQ